MRFLFLDSQFALSHTRFINFPCREHTWNILQDEFTKGVAKYVLNQRKTLENDLNNSDAKQLKGIQQFLNITFCFKKPYIIYYFASTVPLV